MPEMLPLPLDYEQSKELRKLLHAAVTDAVQAFTNRHIVKGTDGVPISGPDPRVIQREAGFHLTRILADYDIFDGAFSKDAIDPRAYDARFRELEAELTRPATPQAPVAPSARTARQRAAARGR